MTAPQLEHNVIPSRDPYAIKNWELTLTNCSFEALQETGKCIETPVRDIPDEVERLDAVMPSKKFRKYQDCADFVSNLTIFPLCYDNSTLPFLLNIGFCNYCKSLYMIPRNLLQNLLKKKSDIEWTKDIKNSSDAEVQAKLEDTVFKQLQERSVVQFPAIGFRDDSENFKMNWNGDYVFYDLQCTDCKNDTDVDTCQEIWHKTWSGTTLDDAVAGMCAAFAKNYNPPFLCFKTKHKEVLEIISLAFSFTSVIYGGCLLILWVVLRCSTKNKTISEA
eukprot:m.34218 g.34218  ORF g.34218 m.34218 type:complete len:276 (-) comp8690_c0_seq1:154-981(-)